MKPGCGNRQTATGKDLVAAKRFGEYGAVLQVQLQGLVGQCAELREEPEFRTDGLSRQGFH
jgi:hypothetical protein